MQAQRDRVQRLVLDTPLAEAQRRGLVLTGLLAEPWGTMHTELLVRLRPTGGGALARHTFVPGQPVVLRGSAPGSPDTTLLEATMAGQQGDGWLTVAVGGAAGAAALGRDAAARCWRLDAGPCLTPLQRQLDALGALGRLEGLSPGTSRMRAVLLGGRATAAAAAAEPPDWARHPRWRSAVAASLARRTELNPSQRRAVAGALQRTLSLWQGPPGTGKTQTLLALIQTALEAGVAAPPGAGPLLAVADTNAGADNLLEGLRARGIAAVRVGAPTRVRPTLRSLTLDALLERTAEGGRAVALRQRAQVLLRRSRGQDGSDPCDAPGLEAGPRQARTPSDPGDIPAHLASAVAGKVWREADSLSDAAAARVLRAAQVVVATCASSSERRLAGTRWAMAVLDEAAQAGEASSLVPLLRGAQAAVLVGDPAQLPPTGHARRSPAAGTAQELPTLFHRLAALAALPVALLDTQYRMHPALAAYPAAAFYGGRLRCGVTSEDRPLVAGISWPGQPRRPLLFLDCLGRERVAPARLGGDNSRSYCNPSEAQEAVLMAKHMLASDPSVRSVAILAPYTGQVDCLLRHARVAGLRLTGVSVSDPGGGDVDGDPAGRAPRAPGGAPPRDFGAPRGCDPGLAPPQVLVSTIDGFQGREADVVLLSTTRTLRLGFLADRRRLNVAITRARRGLVVLGCAALLDTDPYWSGWLRSAGYSTMAGTEEEQRQDRHLSAASCE